MFVITILSSPRSPSTTPTLSATASRFITANSPTTSLATSDCVIICTEHSDVDYRRVCELAPLIVDTRNALTAELRDGSKAKIVRL